MANHYRVEPVHRELVTKFALHLFDQLKPIHQLTTRDRLYYFGSCFQFYTTSVPISLLMNITTPDYIIRHTSITGLSVHERQIIAAIARYHSSTNSLVKISATFSNWIPVNDYWLLN